MSGHTADAPLNEPTRLLLWAQDAIPLLRAKIGLTLMQGKLGTGKSVSTRYGVWVTYLTFAELLNAKEFTLQQQKLRQEGLELYLDAVFSARIPQGFKVDGLADMLVLPTSLLSSFHVDLHLKQSTT